MRPPFFVCACAAQMVRARMRAQKTGGKGLSAVGFYLKNGMC